MLACFGLGVCAAGPALALDDGPSADALYNQGLKQYSDGDLPAAKSTLERVDPLQLPKEQRVQLFQALQDIERLLDGSAPPQELYDKALQAQREGNYARAATYYRAVVKHAQADATQRANATARLAEIRRSADAQVTQYQQLVADATAEIQAGKLDDAERKLMAVKEAGVDLGWFENERVDRQLALINQMRQNSSAPGKVVTRNGNAGGADPLAEAKKLYVQEKLAAARAAERQAQYRLAAESYQSVLKVEPDNADAQAGLKAAQAKDNFALAPRGVLESEKEALRLRQEATISEYNQLINRAKSLAEARNFAAAREAVSQAKITLDRNERYLAADRYRQLREEAIRTGASIDDAQRVAEANQQKELEQRRIKDAGDREKTALAERDEQVQKLIERAVELRREGKFEGALNQLKQAKFLDRNNPSVNLLIETIEDLANYVKARDLVRKRGTLIQAHHIENTEATIPYNNLITFPPDWPELTAKRLAGLEETPAALEANQRVDLKLRDPITVNFENNRLSAVFEFLQTSLGVNFDIRWSILTNIGVERTMPITVQFPQVTTHRRVLDKVVAEASAVNELDPIGWSVSDGIIVVSTIRDLKRSTRFTRTYDIHDLLVQIPSFDDAPEFDLSSALNRRGTSGGGSGSGGGGGRSGGSGGGSLFGDSGGGDSDEDLEADRQQQIDDLLELIRTTVGERDDWVEFGGDVSSISELNGLLIVNTTPDSHKQLSDLLTQLRQTRSMQISVEARFLLVDQNFLDEVGIDIDLQIGDGGADDKVGPIKFSQDSYSVTNRPLSTGLPGSFGSAAASATGIGSFLAGSGFGATNQSLGVSFYYLDDWGVNVLVRATKNSRRAISLTAPRITFFNGQRAYVTVARQVAFVSDLEPVPNASGFNPTIDVVQAGVLLDVEGTISADRRYVTMTVRPSLSAIAEIRRVEFTSEQNENGTTTNNNNNNNDATTITGAIEAPQLELTEVRTSVIVPDRGTLMLGGQRLVGDIEIEAGVPVLSKIPVLNRFFTNRTKVKDERILLILVKPTIIIQTEEEENLFPGLQDNPTQYNIGRQL